MVTNIIYIDRLNSNDRIYDLVACKKIISDFKKMPVCYGELFFTDLLEISFKNISHVIKNIWIDGDILKADIDILDNDSGRILKSRIKGVRFSAKSNGYVEDVSKIVCLTKFFTLIPIDRKEWSYAKYEERELKLKRILNL